MVKLLIIEQLNQRFTTKDLLQAGGKISAAITIAWVASKIRRR